MQTGDQEGQKSELSVERGRRRSRGPTSVRTGPDPPTGPRLRRASQLRRARARLYFHKYNNLFLSGGKSTDGGCCNPRGRPRRHRVLVVLAFVVRRIGGSGARAHSSEGKVR